MSATLPISKWLKRSKFHDGLFFWVHALKVNLPAIGIDGAIKNFIKHNGYLSDEKIDDKKVKSLVTEYHRWVKELYAHQKTG